MEMVNRLAEPTTLPELMQSMPMVWTVLLSVVLAAGFLVWALGSRLARGGLMVSGFVAGGLCAAALASTLMAGAGKGAAGPAGEAGWWVVAIAVGGAVAGMLLAALLFRVWVALVSAIVFAAVVPLSMLVWQGNGPTLTAIQDGQTLALDALGAGQADPDADALRQALEARRQREAEESRELQASEGVVEGATKSDPSAESALREADADSIDSNHSSDEVQGVDAESNPPGDAEAEEGLADLLPALEDVNPAELLRSVIDWPRLREDLAGVWSVQVDQVRGWWSELPREDRRFLLAGSCVGGVAGLVLGFAMPYLLASAQSALVGAVLIGFAGRLLLLLHVPGSASMMPQSWRGVILTLGLITLLGVLVQWTLRRRKADD